jgi:hypothetical protein
MITCNESLPAPAHLAGRLVVAAADGARQISTRER